VCASLSLIESYPVSKGGNRKKLLFGKTWLDGRRGKLRGCGHLVGFWRGKTREKRKIRLKGGAGRTSNLWQDTHCISFLEEGPLQGGRKMPEIDFRLRTVRSTPDMRLDEWARSAKGII